MFSMYVLFLDFTIYTICFNHAYYVNTVLMYMVGYKGSLSRIVAFARRGYLFHLNK